MSSGESAMAARVNAELNRLHSNLTFVSPASHLYNPNNFVQRPPAGVKLPYQSNMRTIDKPTLMPTRENPLKNQLGEPLSEVTWGRTRSEVLAKGGLTAEALLAVPVDAEQAALAHRLALQPLDPEMAGTMAHEIMKRDTVRGEKIKSKWEWACSAFLSTGALIVAPILFCARYSAQTVYIFLLTLPSSPPP
jgi:hypothetical protein